jgi:tryptophan 2,3-dioxygenase
MLTILKTMVAQTDVLETMTPIQFAGFRHQLDTASGFQSAQFREFEFFLGNKNERLATAKTHGEATRTKLLARLAAPSVYDAFLRFLAREGQPVPSELLERDVRERYAGDGRVQEILLGIYRRGGPLLDVCERLVDLDEGVQEWRYRHVKMVERTIGNKIGTGGSSGVEFLRQSLFRPAFPDLWEIRSRF